LGLDSYVDESIGEISCDWDLGWPGFHADGAEEDAEGEEKKRYLRASGVVSWKYVTYRKGD
jgi:hypothetical protein